MITNLDIVYQNLKTEGQKIVGFGKHKNNTYEFAYTIDRKYCNWCLTLEPRTFLMYDFQKYIIKMSDFGF